MDIEVLNIELVLDNEKLKGLATIELKDIIKVSGIKILRVAYDIYCCCLNQSHTKNGLRKWSNILTFEQKLWLKIQKEILKEYERVKEDVERKA